MLTFDEDFTYFFNKPFFVLKYESNTPYNSEREVLKLMDSLEDKSSSTTDIAIFIHIF